MESDEDKTKGQDMRFGLVRTFKKEVREYQYDGGMCPTCNHPTQIGDDASRRFCSWERCNALIIE